MHEFFQDLTQRFEAVGITAEAIEDGLLSTSEIYDIYQAREAGMRLYGEKKYDEAFPHLMTAATHGLKKAQAQLGFMHLHGLGSAKKDTRYAVGWLGVAADGLSEAAIDKYFKSIWDQIPEENVPAYQAVVNTFVAKYGTEANNVECYRANKVGSKIRTVRCDITDPDGRLVSDLIDEMGRDADIGFEGLGVAPGGAPQ